MRSALPPFRTICMALPGLLLAPAAPADDITDTRMINLASISGCLTCHSVKATDQGSAAMKPIGPPWPQVAARYRNNPGATETLVLTVMRGSSAYAPHWKDQVSGYAMPPNAVALTEPQARALVGWILQLK